MCISVICCICSGGHYWTMLILSCSWHQWSGKSSAGRRRRASWRPASRRTRKGCWSWRATGSRRKRSATPSMNTWRRPRPSTRLWRRSTTKPRSSSKTSSRSEWTLVKLITLDLLLCFFSLSGNLSYTKYWTNDSVLGSTANTVWKCKSAGHQQQLRLL